MDTYDEQAAWNSALAHPFHVILAEGGRTTKAVGFQTREEAFSFARSRPERHIELFGPHPWYPGKTCIASRVLDNPFGVNSRYAFVPRDDFPAEDGA